MWEARWNLPYEALGIYWSGMKGISIEVPAILFGGFEPSVAVAEERRNLAMAMTPGAQTLDISIYHKVSLWRVPNTRHGGSGLYNVPVTIQVASKRYGLVHPSLLDCCPYLRLQLLRLAFGILSLLLPLLYEWST